MRFTIKNPSGESVVNLMRRIGYHFLEENSGFSFIRPLERRGYPRFHLHSKIEDNKLILNLHLDQKRPLYRGVPAHAAEYKGKVVEKEAERIKQTLQ